MVLLGLLRTTPTHAAYEAVLPGPVLPFPGLGPTLGAMAGALPFPAPSGTGAEAPGRLRDEVAPRH